MNAAVIHNPGPYVILRPPQAAEESRLPAKWFSLAAAIALHVAVLGFGGSALYEPAQFGVQSGVSSIDLDLVAPPVVQAPPAQTPILPQAEFVDTAHIESSTNNPPEATPASPRHPEAASAVEGSITPKSISSSASDGAIWSDPQYLANHPPKYPREALMNNVEGTTTLIANIDEKGRPLDIRVEKTSGSADLDASALRAVRQWSFSPARVAGIAVKSRSRIPITFRIDSKK